MDKKKLEEKMFKKINTRSVNINKKLKKLSKINNITFLINLVFFVIIAILAAIYSLMKTKKYI